MIITVNRQPALCAPHCAGNGRKTGGVWHEAGYQCLRRPEETGIPYHLCCQLEPSSLTSVYHIPILHTDFGGDIEKRNQEQQHITGGKEKVENHIQRNYDDQCLRGDSQL